MKVRDLIRVLDDVFPLSRAEKWDKVGLQVGDNEAEISRAVVAHEINHDILQSLENCALVIYHPLIFRPLENLNFANHTAKLAAQCIARDLHVIAVHTALDNAPPLVVKKPGALGDALAAELGLAKVQVLAPSGRENLCKIAVFVPPSHLETVQNAMWQAGAGHIGLYDEASFRVHGQGTFRPLPGANPFAGKVGEREEAEEWRLEVIVPEAQSGAVIAAMKAAHPYEEVAYDVYPLRNTAAPYGSARVGELAANVSLSDYAVQVQSALRAPNVRVVQGKNEICRVACVPGSGASFIDDAVKSGCDCLVTGDIKHHDALKAQALGLSLIDATHTATERAAMPLIADVLRAAPDLMVETCDVDTNPFWNKELQMQN